MNEIRIFEAIQEVYFLESLEALILSGKKYESFRHSHERFMQDFQRFKTEYYSKIANAIFDYTVKVVAAELRHCKQHSMHYLSSYIDSGFSRNSVYHNCNQYNPYDIIKAGIWLFNEQNNDWEDSYGGDKWKNIAKSALMYKKTPDIVYIDHCVDLSHNNSVYFDKGAGIFLLSSQYDYLDMLDNKKFESPRYFLRKYCWKEFPLFCKLYQRATFLELVPYFECAFMYFTENELFPTTETLVLSYIPTNWGHEQLEFEIKENFECPWFDDEERRRRREREVF